MDTPILVAIISAAASITVVAFTFFFTKRKEREAEWRKQKLEHYREFLDALSGVTAGTNSANEAKVRWARASNTIGLVASQHVLLTLSQFQDSGAKRNQNYSSQDHSDKLNQLMLAIREDLSISPKDDPKSFSFQLSGSGVNN